MANAPIAYYLYAGSRASKIAIAGDEIMTLVFNGGIASGQNSDECHESPIFILF